LADDEVQPFLAAEGCPWLSHPNWMCRDRRMRLVDRKGGEPDTFPALAGGTLITIIPGQNPYHMIRTIAGC